VFVIFRLTAKSEATAAFRFAFVFRRLRNLGRLLLFFSQTVFFFLPHGTTLLSTSWVK